MKQQRPLPSSPNPLNSLQSHSPLPQPIATPSTSHPKASQSPFPHPQDEIQSIAMNLSATIFMTSTTKFMKGLQPNPLNTSTPTSKQKKNQSPLLAGSLTFIPSVLRHSSQEKASETVRKTSNSKETPQGIVYPSKAKIQTIVNGKTNKNAQQSPNANSDLKRVLSRNRLGNNTIRNARNSSSSFSQSRSGSVSRLSRRKKVRELKFIQKKEQSETSINPQGVSMSIAVPTKNDTKIKMRPMKMATESQISIGGSYQLHTKVKPQEKQPSTPLTNIRSLKNIHEVKQAQAKNLQKSKKVQVKKMPASSIISDISPKQVSKLSGYKINAFLPSGELPLQTPVKPLKAQKKGSKETEVSLILEQNSSQINSSKYKSKKMPNQCSTKQESSTLIEFNLSQVKGKQQMQSNISKFAKNESTKAIGKEEEGWGISTIIRMQQQGSKNEAKTNIVSVYEPKKPASRTNTVKDVEIAIKPIANSLSFFDVSSPKKGGNSLNTEKSQTSLSKIPLQSTFLQSILERLYLKNIKNSFSQLRSKANSQVVNIKKAQILLSSLAGTYNQLALTNQRTTFQKLKKVALSNLANTKPALKTNNPYNILANLVHRIQKGKMSQYFSQLRLKSWANSAQKSLISCKNPIRATQASSDEAQKQYLLSQLSKISENTVRSNLKKGFAKILLRAISQALPSKPKQQPQTVKSPPKYQKSARNLQAQMQKLSRNQQLFSSQIYKLQVKLADKKRSTNIEKAKLQRKQEELSKQNKKIQQQSKQTQLKNSNLKNHLQLINPQQEFDISLPQFQPLIGLLTEVYCAIFRNNDPEFKPSALISKYSLSLQDQNPLLQAWQCLSLNASLKSQLSQWQGRGKLPRPKQLMLQQQQLISKVLRSYVRERYLWQWLKLTTQQL